MTFDWTAEEIAGGDVETEEDSPPLVQIPHARRAGSRACHVVFTLRWRQVDGDQYI